MFTKLIANANGTLTAIDTRDYRPEPTAEQRQAEQLRNQMTRAQVQTQYRWSNEDFDQALRYGFPKGTGTPGMNNYKYDRLKVEPWVAEFKAFAKRLR